jgi:secreted trypsin-like serine protease
VGGTPVPTNDTALYSSYAIPKNQRLFCGAILIWDDVLLSAGHCEGGFNFTSQTVLIGGTALNGTDAIERGIAIRKAIVHPDYMVPSIDNEVENDIMLVFLSRSTNPIVPIARINFEPAIPPDNAVVTVIGHGIVNRTADADLTYNLNALNMTIVNFFTCDNSYDVLNIDVHLCATGTRTAVAPCEGDSGGPLLLYDTVTKRNVVVGIVSFGFCSFQPDRPSTVFTRVSSYQNWILSTICKNSLRKPTTDMCNGVVPLERIASNSSTTISPTLAPIVPNTPCSNATCTYLFFLRGTVVHRSILGTCIQKCTIVRVIYTLLGWKCGSCS